MHAPERPSSARDAPHRSGLALLRRVKDRIAHDHLPIIAAGVAFYGLLAIFPALAALVAVYGLVLDPQQVGRQIEAMQGMLPAQAVQLLVAQLQDLTTSDRQSLGFGAAGALMLALWGASAGIRTLIKALNVAYDVHEQRSVVRRTALALLLTAGAIAGGILAIAAVVVLPVVLDFVRLDPLLRSLLAYARWPIMAAVVWLGLLVVYRFGPNRRDAQWSWRDPGAAAAVVLWLAGSAGFSWYVENLANFNRTYGSMGAVVVLLMWFLLSAYAVLLGAELDAELEGGRGSAGGSDQPPQFRLAGEGSSGETG